jgi:hypothetical protein
MKTLFEIEEERLRLNTMIEEAAGELTPELEAALEVNEQNLMDKAKTYREIILSNNTDIDLARQEIKRLQDLVKSRERTNEAMKTRLKDAMQLFGVPRIALDGGVGGVLSFRKSEQVSIEDETAIADTYKKVTYTIDKAAIKAAIKEGNSVAGATIIENMNLQIK